MAYIGTSPSNGVRRVHTYTATAGQTTFTGSSTEGVTLTYADTNYIDVFQNGVLLGIADYTSTSGTSVVLSQGCSLSDLVVIVVYDVFSVADTVSKTAGGSFDSNVTVNTAMSAINTGGDAHVQIKGNTRDFKIEQNNYGLRIYDTDALSERLRIDASGAMTLPLQPAFSAKATNDQTNIAVGSNVTLVLDSERFDQNGDFSSNTFTAPVTGKYQLQTVVYFQNLDSASTVYNVKITTSNTDYQAPFDPDFGQDNGYWGWGFSILADMDANDTAYVFVRQTGGTQQTDLANSSYFSGYLVC